MIKLKELLNEIQEACWDTHKQIGMKEKDGRMVPNCIKKEGFVDDDNIEEVQTGLDKFIKEIEPEMKYFSEFGIVGSAYPHYDSMKKILAAYQELIKLMPSEPVAKDA